MNKKHLLLLSVIGDGPLAMRVHAFLDRHGFINFGVYKQLEPLPGTCVAENVDSVVLGWHNFEWIVFFPVLFPTYIWGRRMMPPPPLYFHLHRPPYIVFLSSHHIPMTLQPGYSLRSPKLCCPPDSFISYPFEHPHFYDLQCIFLCLLQWPCLCPIHQCRSCHCPLPLLLDLHVHFSVAQHPRHTFPVLPWKACLCLLVLIITVTFVDSSKYQNFIFRSYTVYNRFNLTS